MYLGLANELATFDQGTTPMENYNQDIQRGVYPQVTFNNSLLPIYNLESTFEFETVLNALLPPFSNDLLLDQMLTNVVVHEEESIFGVNQGLVLVQRPSTRADATGVFSDSKVSPLSSPTFSMDLGLSHKKTRNRPSKFKKDVKCSCGTNLERILHIGNHLLRRGENCRVVCNVMGCEVVVDRSTMKHHFKTAHVVIAQRNNKAFESFQ